jgi:hypothetical protein
MYKPSNVEVQTAKSIYDNIVVNQVLEPVRVKEAYAMIFGEKPINLTHAKIKLFAWFQYEYKNYAGEAITDSVGTLLNKNDQSHDEGEVIAEVDDELIEMENKLIDLEQEIRFLQNQAEPNEFTESKIDQVKLEIKNLKSKITKTKNKK